MQAWFYLIEVHVYFCKDEVQKCNGMHGMDVDHACECMLWCFRNAKSDLDHMGVHG